MATYAIGDIYGCYHTLIDLINKLHMERQEKRDEWLKNVPKVSEDHLAWMKEFDKIEYCKDCDFLYDDPSVLVWSNDPDAKPNWILGTNFLLSDCTNLK